MVISKWPPTRKNEPALGTRAQGWSCFSSASHTHDLIISRQQAFGKKKEASKWKRNDVEMLLHPVIVTTTSRKLL